MLNTNKKLKRTGLKILAAFSATAVAAALLVLPGTAPGDATDTSAGTSTDTSTDTSSSGDALTDIRKFTWHTWHQLKTVNANLTLIFNQLNQWLVTPPVTSPSPDPTSMLQSNFATYTTNIQNTQATGNSLQKTLTANFLGTDVTTGSVPYANDMTYQTLMGFPWFSPDPRSEATPGIDPAQNYIINAAALNQTHQIPIMESGTNGWQGTDVQKQKYQNFYETISAIQTFNAHVLGEIYADYKNGGAASASQANLIQQASNSAWFTIVQSEPIGLVLRQILMYTSQSLSVMTQILQTEKELLASQAMTNTLLIVGNQFTEQTLLTHAQNGGP